MSEYFNVVPWFNSEEWLKVYNYVYLSLNRVEAHNLLLVWKARCPSLPSGIQSTLTLLEVIIQDEKSTDKFDNDQVLRLAYSSAIMRFVNHMLDTETARGVSLYQAAKNLGVPDWIIDLRHDTAHSNNLPSIELLREASLIGLDWLQRNYWDKLKECIQDYISGQTELETTENSNIAALMNFCLSLSFCTHSRCKIKNLSEIPNPSMRESIVNDARDLFSDKIDFSNLKTVSITFLINTLNTHSKKFIRSDEDISAASRALLGEDSLILSMDLLNFLGSSEYYYKTKLSASYVQCFQGLLTFLHTNDILLQFILDLIQITNKGEDGYRNRCKLAAMWVSEILRSLSKSKQFREKIRRTIPTDSKKQNELRLLYRHWFPNDNAKGLLLDLQKPVPAQLMQIEFLRPIISSYNPYLRYFIKQLLCLVEPPLPSSVAANICQLTELISSPNKFPMTSAKIHTVDDLKEDSQDELISSNMDEMEIDNPVAVGTPIPKTLPTFTYGIWRTSEQHNWCTCPFGMVPWQM